MIDTREKRTAVFIAAVLGLIALCLAGALLVPAHARAETVTIALEEWSSEIASGNVVKAVLQKYLGIKCKLKRMSVTDQYAALANGSVDVMLGAWLPSQGTYYDQHKDLVDDMGPNLEGARMGLVVPQVSSTWLMSEDAQHTEPYMVIDGIVELNDHYDDFGGKIIGIEQDSGMMKIMRDKLMPTYGLEDFELVVGNEEIITTALASAIKKKEWIVILGWTPHWKFGRWKLKFLDDPKKIWPALISIHTLARKGLKEEMPKVYGVLDKFRWTPEEMEQLLVWNEMKDAPYDNALRWMNYNQERVNSWVK